MTHAQELYPPDMGPTERGMPPIDETKERRARIFLRLAILCTAVVVIGCLVVTTYAVVAIRSTQSKNSPVLKKINDCTEPGGECYREGRRQTAAAVGDIGRYVVLAAACAADVDATQPVDQRISQITACVTRRLAEPTPQQP